MDLTPPAIIVLGLLELGEATPYELKVRAKDRAGNWSSWALLAPATSGVAQDTSSTVRRSGEWRSASNTSYSKGTSIYARAAGATLSRTFTGRAIAWVAAMGSTRGSAKVYIDGAYVTTVSQYRSDAAYRRIVWSKSWASSGEHTLKIVVTGTAGRPRIDLDALVVIR